MTEKAMCEVKVSIDGEQVTITMMTGLRELVDSLSSAQLHVAFDAMVLFGYDVPGALERVLNITNIKSLATEEGV